MPHYIFNHLKLYSEALNLKVNTFLYGRFSNSIDGTKSTRVLDKIKTFFCNTTQPDILDEQLKNTDKTICAVICAGQASSTKPHIRFLA